jgi:hypothetical protein
MISTKNASEISVLAKEIGYFRKGTSHENIKMAIVVFSI